jgi:hypothetical protein
VVFLAYETDEIRVIFETRFKEDKNISNVVLIIKEEFYE